MLGRAIDRKGVAPPAGQHVLEGCFRIERSAALVEYGQFQPRAETNRTGVGLKTARQHADQRRFPGPVGTDDTHAAASENTDREILDDGPLTEEFRNLLGLHHHRAGRTAFGNRHFDVALRPAIIAHLLAQAREQIHAAHIALAARGDAIAHPMFFRRDLAGQLVLFLLFLFEEVVAPGLKSCKALIDPACLTPVDPDRRARQIGKKPPVVADQHQCRAQRFELAFQPFDGRQVQMVRRFVEQKNIGFGRQHPRQCRPPGLAA